MNLKNCIIHCNVNIYHFSGETDNQSIKPDSLQEKN